MLYTSRWIVFVCLLLSENYKKWNVLKKLIHERERCGVKYWLLSTIHKRNCRMPENNTKCRRIWSECDICWMSCTLKEGYQKFIVQLAQHEMTLILRTPSTIFSLYAPTKYNSFSLRGIYRRCTGTSYINIQGRKFHIFNVFICC